MFLSLQEGSQQKKDAWVTAESLALILLHTDTEGAFMVPLLCMGVFFSP